MCSKHDNILRRDLVKLIRFRQLHPFNYTLLYNKHFIALVLIIDAIILLSTMRKRSIKYHNKKSDKDMISLTHHENRQNMTF